MNRCFALALLLVACPTPRAVAQSPWLASYYPYVFGDPTNGVMLVAHYHYARMADYFDRVPFAGIFSAEAGIGARGSRFAVARFTGPRLLEGWRFAGETGAIREPSFGFSDDRDADTFDATDPAVLERVHRTRYLMRGDVTRRITGPLQLAIGGTLEHVRFSRLPGESVFREIHGDLVAQTDLMGRLALVLDTRDKEFVTGNGVWLEAGVYAGTGGDGYRGAYGIARGYVSPRGGTVLAGRIAARSLGGTPPLNALYTVPGWEEPLSVLGGVESHRSFVRGRLRGIGMLLATAEVRHDVLNLGDYGAITALAFTDAGRVFQDDFEWTTAGWSVGGGGGVALRILRSTVVTFNFAGGPDGFLFMMGNGWAF